MRGQAPGAQYVCKSCRHQEKVDPQALLDQILGVAGDASPALPGAPLSVAIASKGNWVGAGWGWCTRRPRRAPGAQWLIKTMPPDAASNENAVAMFLREVEVTRQLKHPNIVELLHHGHAKGTFYSCSGSSTAWISGKVPRVQGRQDRAERGGAHHDGRSCGAWARPQRGAEGQGCRWGQQDLCRTVHRDLKPANVFLARNNRIWTPKVADFGLAKSFESAGPTKITVLGQLCGTPRYWPREEITTTNTWCR